MRNLVLASFVIALGCSSADEPAPATLDQGAVQSPPPTKGGDPCATPNEGCPCDDPGATAACSAKRISGSYVSCSPGIRTCGDDGKWSACVGDAVYPNEGG